MAISRHIIISYMGIISFLDINQHIGQTSRDAHEDLVPLVVVAVAKLSMGVTLWQYAIITCTVCGFDFFVFMQIAIIFCLHLFIQMSVQISFSYIMNPFQLDKSIGQTATKLRVALAFQNAMTSAVSH